MFVKGILDEKGKDLITIAESETAQAAANLFKTERIGFAIVTGDSSAHVGSVSERDIVQALADHGDLSSTPVTEIMTRNVVTVCPDDTLETVQEIMTERRTRHVIVKEGDKVVGVVSIGDLIKQSLNQCQIDTSQMRDYIGGTGYQ
ncbi:MAG: CBS domain-containing protein [Magnetovibrio sp.]|nr:CBS domain-containing protein [Magnetovibrio sp.]